ncbi:MAG: TIGR01440 family protein [Acutalibacteraceae bacterium]
MFTEITNSAKQAVSELIEAAHLKSGDIMVIGCSSSEVGGNKIGTCSSTDIADAIFSGIYPTLCEKGIYLAAQCCEHLNRAIIIERELADKLRIPIVNAVPQPKAGGSFATAAYKAFKEPCAVEDISADAGIDIGGTLIGMHLKKVAVPVRLSVKTIGHAPIICARTRPKYIGGERAHYDDRIS